MKFGFQTRILKLQYLQDDLLRSVACGYVNFWTFFSECGSLPGRSRVPGAGLVAHRIPSSWSVTFIAWTWLRCKAEITTLFFYQQAASGKLIPGDGCTQRQATYRALRARGVAPPWSPWIVRLNTRDNYASGWCGAELPGC